MIIYTELSSIEADLGYHAKTLYAFSNNLSNHYRSAMLPKRNGGTRILHIPDEALKKLQRAIGEKLLPLESVSPYATAYRPGTSITKNALPHTGKKSILKLDIRHFFDSIPYSLVKEKAFPKERYSEKIRILLTMLCYYKDALPQGAPTSPAISNIILCDFDNDVGEYCKSRGVAYTRYCDDMTFSGDLDDTAELIDFVRSRLKTYGFTLNNEKTKIIAAAKRQMVTGIVVNEKPNLPDKYKRAIRQEVYFIRKFGIRSHLSRIRDPRSPISYLDSLLGRINFVLQICPEDADFREYKQAVADIKKGEGRKDMTDG